MKLKIKFIVSLFLSALFFISCNDYSDLTPVVQDKVSGSADFTRFVTIGNSITAGIKSN